MFTPLFKCAIAWCFLDGFSYGMRMIVNLSEAVFAVGALPPLACALGFGFPLSLYVDRTVFLL